MIIRRILVPLDGSTFAERAIPAAIEVARRSAAALDLLIVDEPSLIPPVAMASAPLLVAAPSGRLDAELNETRRAARQTYVELTASRARAANGDLDIGVTVMTGAAAPTLIAHIEDARDEGRVDLVVMTTHGRGGLTRFWLGSVADAVVRHVTVPVLLVKPSDDPPLVTDDPPAPFRRVLIPLDGSASGLAVLDPVVAVCGRENVEYFIASVSEPLTTLAAGHIGVLPAGAPDGTDAAEPREHYLRGVAARLEAEGYATQTRALVHTSASRAILDLAAELDANLIALTTHGRGGWRRLLIGSVADKVIRGSPGWLLVVRRAPEDAL